MLRNGLVQIGTCVRSRYLRADQVELDTQDGT